MAKYRITGPDGNSYDVNAPDDASQEDVLAYAQKNFKMAAAPKQEGGVLDTVKQGAKDLIAGGVRGAGSIGATLLYPWDKAQDIYYGDRGPNITGLVTGKQPISRNEERRQAMTAALQDLGADPNSLMFKTGKIGTEIAGTLGAGGAVANGIRAVAPGASATPFGARLLEAISTNGMRTGAASPTTMAGRVGDLAIRSGGGAVSGGVGAGMVNPDDAGIGALLGGGIPVAGWAGGRVGSAVRGAREAVANKLMQSAIKPTLNQLKSGDAAVAVETMLQNGLSPNAKGVEKLKSLIDATDDQITGAIANSSARIDKNKVLNALGDVRGTFGMQAAPTADMKAIQAVADDFASHPATTQLPAMPGGEIPVQLAQDMKRATQNVLRKKYGTMGSADTEAQKALARGLKEEIAAAVPGIAESNAKQSKLLKTLDVVERRALMDANKNPGGLSLLAPNAGSLVAFLADRSAALKSLAARGINPGTPMQFGLLNQPLTLPFVRGGLLSLNPESTP